VASSSSGGFSASGVNTLIAHYLKLLSLRFRRHLKLALKGRDDLTLKMCKRDLDVDHTAL